jgi:hypothetical protein
MEMEIIEMPENEFDTIRVRKPRPAQQSANDFKN